MPASVQVEGAGTMAFPLSDQDVDKLSRVSCPQLVPDFFSKVVVDLAVSAMEGLEIDARALGLEARLLRLVVHENGSFKLESDTETKGLIATMILQLPTQSGHEGGELEVFHGERSVSFSFSGANSCKGFYRVLSLCDCELKLAQMKRGRGVYLVFGLVSDNVKYIDDVRSVPNYLSALGTVQKLLRDLACDQRMLVIPLGHTYGNINLGFASLKGYDRVLAALLLSCEGFLDVHLCMVHEDDHPTKYKMCNWETLDDVKARYLDNCNLELDNLVCEDHCIDPFDYDTYHCAAVVVWPKGGEVELLITESGLRWLEEQHRQNPERTGRDLERCVTALVHEPSFALVYELLDFCLRHDFRNVAYTILKKWALLLVASHYNWEMICAAIQKYGWEECYRADNLQEVLKIMDLDYNYKWFGFVSSSPKHLAERGFQDAAVYLAKELIKRQYILSNSKTSMRSLLTFCISCGLEEETWRLLRVVKPCFDEKSLRCLALVVKRWGEKSFLLIEQFCRRSSELSRDSWLGNVAKLVWALERENCHDAALHFAKIIDDDAELYENEDKLDANDALVLLLRSEERFLESVRKLSVFSAQEVVRSIREASRLFDVKRDAKATQIFAKLLQHAIGEEEVKVDMLEAMFWLGDEGLLQNMAKKAGDNPWITKCIVRNSDYLAGKLDDAGKNWLREALKTRIRYLSSDDRERTIQPDEACTKKRTSPWLMEQGKRQKLCTFTLQVKKKRVEVDTLSFALDKI